MKNKELHGEIVQFDYLGEHYTVLVETVTKEKIEGSSLPGFTIYDFELEHIKNLEILDSEPLSRSDLFGFMWNFMKPEEESIIVAAYEKLGFRLFYDSASEYYHLIHRRSSET